MNYLDMYDLLGERTVEYVTVAMAALNELTQEGVDNKDLAHAKAIIDLFTVPDKNYLLQSSITLTEMTEQIFDSTYGTNFVMGLRFHTFMGFTREEIGAFITELAWTLTPGTESPLTNKIGDNRNNYSVIDEEKSPEMVGHSGTNLGILLSNNWLVPLLIYSSYNIRTIFAGQGVPDE